ncbi:hypothetical protein OBBRIDRAFT_193801 [Obba rivulosa]|uniref:Uncharacterized protein n=1 Tax=Obba rivulosa TaxID=1052685 RepID=A0A8E2ARZ0_9APHY|nr:hypothetical protein OBBRIDRAFT_193801 [Obba rivulosa]
MQSSWWRGDDAGSSGVLQRTSRLAGCATFVVAAKLDSDYSSAVVPVEFFLYMLFVSILAIGWRYMASCLSVHRNERRYPWWPYRMSAGRDWSMYNRTFFALNISLIPPAVRHFSLDQLPTHCSICSKGIALGRNLYLLSSRLCSRPP